MEHATAGINSAFAATLHTTGGPVFCKATTDPTSAMHRTEVQVAPFLPAVAPRLLWNVEVDGWLLLGFTHAAGQHADLSPHSPDLALVGEGVSTLANELTPCPPVQVPALADKLTRVAPWRRLRHNPPEDMDQWARERFDEFVTREALVTEAVRGDTLAHTDLHPLNILVSNTAHVIDWAWAQRAAVWVDTAYLVPRLIAAGHEPADAEQWASGLPTWSKASPEEITAFATTIYGWWEWLRVQYPAPHRARLAETARTWAEHRLQAT